MEYKLTDEEITFMLMLMDMEEGNVFEMGKPYWDLFEDCESKLVVMRTANQDLSDERKKAIAIMEYLADKMEYEEMFDCGNKDSTKWYDIEDGITEIIGK